MSPRLLAGVHGAYLLASGVWPILHRSSFEAVTGPKRDFWLVRLVGALAALGGATLTVAAVRGRRSPEARVVGLGSAVVFAAADVYAAVRYSRVYLGDVALQLVLAPAWARRWPDEERPEAVREASAP